MPSDIAFAWTDVCQHINFAKLIPKRDREGGGLLADEQSMPFDLLSLTLDELWAVHDCVRQHDKLGKEWDPGFMERVMAAILVAQGHPASQVVLLCSMEELWQIDRQTPSGLMVGPQPVGRNLLVKVMRLIVKMQGGEENGGDTSAREDTGQGTAGGPDTAASPG